MKVPSKMIVITQDATQWQPYFMRKDNDFSEWRLRPGYTPAGGTGAPRKIEPKVPCLFRVETVNKHMKKAVK